MNPKRDATVFVVDDDRSVRESLRAVMSSVGLSVAVYESAQSFLDDYDPSRPGCLVLDVRMPRMSGLDLMDKLKDERIRIPMIFITGHGDVPTAVKAMKAGAIDFLEKPFSHQDLLDRIHLALQRDADRRDEEVRQEALEARLARLTRREREVMQWVVRGHPNKVIAAELGITLKTVEHHRSRIMEKLQVEGVVELVRLVLGKAPGGEEGA